MNGTCRFRGIRNRVEKGIRTEVHGSRDRQKIEMLLAPRQGQTLQQRRRLRSRTASAKVKHTNWNRAVTELFKAVSPTNSTRFIVNLEMLFKINNLSFSSGVVFRHPCNSFWVEKLACIRLFYSSANATK